MTAKRKPAPSASAPVFPGLCRAAGLPAPVAEYRFAAEYGRKWAMDWCWPDPGHMLGLEVQGGLFVRGRHSRGAGMLRDYEKFNFAACLGYRLLFVTPGQMRSGEALEWVRRALIEEDTD